MVHTIKDGRKVKPDIELVDSAGNPINRAAEEIFELAKISWLLRSRRRRRNAFDLTETEFLTLDLVAREESQTVGQLRKHVGVLPAQMSRILRSLERRGDKPLIKCAINAIDRRRIDVSITETGRKAHRAFREARTSLNSETLAQLPPQDVREFMRIMEKIRTLMLPNFRRWKIRRSKTQEQRWAPGSESWLLLHNPLWTVARYAVIETVALDGLKTRLADQPAELLCIQVLPGPLPFPLRDVVPDHRAVKIIHAPAQAHLRQFDRLDRPEGLDVREVVQHQPADCQGLQVIQT